MPIHCSLYDALELMCLRRYSIRLFLHSGAVYTGTAQDLAVREEGGESIAIQTAAGAQWLALSELAAVEVLDSGAPMRRLEFTGACEP